MTDTMLLLPGLSLVEGKPLTATFDAGRLSSDDGVIILREIALRLGLAEASRLHCWTTVTRAACNTGTRRWRWRAR
jgi:hypothetical protein